MGRRITPIPNDWPKIPANAQSVRVIYGNGRVEEMRPNKDKKVTKTAKKTKA